MTGTIVNTFAVIIGGLIGLVFKKGIKENIQKSVNQALGLAVIVLGLNGVITSMLTVSQGTLSSDGTLLLIVSLVLGVIAGEMMRIDDRLNSLGDKIGHKMNIGNFSEGFITASLIFCVGAMTIVGALNDGLKGDSSILFVKSALDFIASIVLSATIGVGVIFSALCVLVYQGAISLLAGCIGPYLSGEVLNQICMVGYVSVMCIGINFLGMAKIKTANFLPAMLVPVVWNIMLWVWNLIV